PDGPGFRKIIIKPAVVGDLKWVKASYNSIHGRIISDWKREGSNFTLAVTIPANTSARVYVPTKSPTTITENGMAVRDNRNVKCLREASDGYAVYEIRSGEYVFQSRL